MANFIQLESKTILDNLRNHEKGEIAYVKDENKYYVFKDEWVEVEPSKEILGMSLYEMNKMVLGQLPKLDAKAIAEAKTAIYDYVHDKDHADDYYMLLCHELKYFTVFVNDENCDDGNSIEIALMDCLSYVGEIKSIERTEDKQAIEIWVTTPEDDTYVMYFFDYGRGIVPCRI